MQRDENLFYTKLSKIKNKSKFKKNIIISWINDNPYYFLNDTKQIIDYIHYFYKIPEKEISILLTNKDNIINKIIQLITNIVSSQTHGGIVIISHKIIQETFITILALELLNFCYEINSEDITCEIMLINYIDYLIDEIKISDKIKKLIHYFLYKKFKSEDLTTEKITYLNSHDSSIIENIIFMLNKITNKNIISLLYHVNFSGKIKQNVKYILIINYLNIQYNKELTLNVKHIFSLIVTLLDDVTDLNEDSHNKSENVILTGKHSIYGVLSTILNLHNKLANTSNIKKRFFNDMILHVMGLALANNKNIPNKLISSIDDKIYLPLSCLNQNTHSLHFTKYNFIFNYYLFNINSRLLQYDIPFDNHYDNHSDYAFFMSRYKINNSNQPIKFNKIVNIITEKVLSTMENELLINKLLTDVSTTHLNEIIKYILNQKGKNIRSIFNILLYLSVKHDQYVTHIDNDKLTYDTLDKYDNNLNKLVIYCSALELIHLSSLIHDDVIDESVIRRSNTTLNLKYSNKIAILFGDYLITKAYKLLTTFDSKTVDVKTVNETNNNIISLIQTLITGEVNELTTNFKPTTFQKYIQRIYQKTGVFLEVNSENIYKLAYPSCDDTDKHKFFKNLGINLGIAFQIKDDLLDYQSDSNTLGKPVYEDLINGIVTAPYLFSLDDNPDISMILTLAELKKIKKEKIKNIFDNILISQHKNNKRTFIDKTQDLVNYHIEISLDNLNKIIPIQENYHENIFLQNFIQLILYVGSRII